MKKNSFDKNKLESKEDPNLFRNYLTDNKKSEMVFKNFIIDYLPAFQHQPSFYRSL